jgi:peroxiredoxin
MDVLPHFGAALRSMGRFACILVLALAWLSSTRSSAAVPSLVGKVAPDFALRARDGRNLRLSEFRGQVVLLNFWARWASESRKQLRELDQINTTYERAGLMLLGISVDEDSRRTEEFVGAMGVTYPVLFDINANTARDYGVGKMPMTVLVDRAGVIRFINVGFKRGDERIYLDEIRELLRE